MVKISILGRARLQRRLDAIPKEVKGRVKQQIEAQATRIVSLMKSLVPVDTGGLRDSIKWTWGRPPKGANILGQVKNSLGSELAVTIYAGDESTLVNGEDQRFFYQLARLIEFGTSSMPAQPFFWGVWREEKRTTKRKVREEIRKAVKATKL